MSVTDAWSQLGIEPTDDVREVKRAYAKALKAIDVDRDPDAFIQLREARDLALQWGAELPEWERPDYDPEQDWVRDNREDALDGGNGQTADLPFRIDFDRFDPFFGGQGGPDAGRPPPAAPKSQHLRDSARKLEGLLFDEEVPAPADVKSAAIVLLAACADAPVDEAAEVEQWLLAALARSIPRSDPAFILAECHFGWDDAIRSRGYGFNPELFDLIDRRAARDLLDEILKERDPVRYYAVAELMQAGRTRLGWFEPGLARDVKRFLDNTVAAHPMIEHDFARDTLAWWRGYFEGFHLPQGFWLALLSYPAFSTMIARWAGIIDSSARTLAIAFGVIAAVLAIGMLVHAYLRVYAVRREQEVGWYSYSIGPAVALVAVAMLLPVLASILGGGLWAAAGWSLAAAVIMACALFATPSPASYDPDGQHMVPVGTPAAGLAACAAVGFSLSLGEVAQVAVPFLMLCHLVYRTHRLLADRLARLARRPVRLALAGAGLFLAAMLIALFAFAPRLPPAVLLALVPAAVMTQHLVTAGVILRVTAIEWCARAGAILFHIVIGKQLFADWGTSAIASILLYLLAYSLIRIVLAWPQAGRQEAEPAFF